jgi:hypothetical protein
MRYLKFILSVIVVLLIITAIVENHGVLSTTVHFNFDVFTLHYQTGGISLYYIASMPFLLGVIITGILGMAERFRLKRQIKSHYKIMRDKDREIDSLRNLRITKDSVAGDETAK